MRISRYYTVIKLDDGYSQICIYNDSERSMTTIENRNVTGYCMCLEFFGFVQRRK